MTDLPLITIGIPCFNAEDTIARAVCSAQAAAWRPVEILVVDDAGADSAAAIVASLAAEDPRIRLITHAENRGVAAARNTIVDNAAGEYIVFLDDDDEMVPDRLDMQHALLLRVERGLPPGTPVLCYGARHAHGTILPGIGADCPVQGPAVADYVLLQSFAPGFPAGKAGTCTLFARRSVLQAYPFDPEFRRRGDGELLVRIALAGGWAVSTSAPVIVQHLTQADAEKGAAAECRYAKMLARKYAGYLGPALSAALLLADADALWRRGKSTRALRGALPRLHPRAPHTARVAAPDDQTPIR